MLGINEIYLGDCLELMPEIADKSVDMILCDLPYGITACEWDIPISLDKLWEQYKRIIKDRGAIVLTGSQPFTSKLVMSNLEWFKYEWVWEKTRTTDFLLANNRPMKSHENVIVFCETTTKYNPQKSAGDPYYKKQASEDKQGIYNTTTRKIGDEKINRGTRMPRSAIKFSNPNNSILHPTQKPIKLFEYLIKTYTDEGDTVLDNCIGSGTTAIAAANTGRQFIGIEKDPEYHAVALKRLERETRQADLFVRQAV